MGASKRVGEEVNIKVKILLRFAFICVDGVKERVLISTNH